MDGSEAIDSLKRFPSILTSIVRNLPSDILTLKPTSNDWSIHEIICHLADEEEFDFSVRLKLTLEKADSWPPIDPEGWAIQKRYSELDFQQQLDRFLDLRQKSINWFAKIDVAKWNLDESREHPKLGTFRAGDLLFAWSAHDLLHMRQITKRLFQFNHQSAGEYKTIYAGDW